MKRLTLIFIFLFVNQAILFAEANVTPQPEDQRYTEERQTLVEGLKKLNIRNADVLSAMGKVQRHEFVPSKYSERSYENVSLPIGKIQTISGPYMVALMTEAIRPKPEYRVLEIGTGTGYSAAVLGEIVKDVYTIEIDEKLASTAKERLARLGYTNVHVKAGDGFFGWPEEAPFDAIIMTCNTDKVPKALASQLKEGGRLVMPLGKDYSPQTMVVITKTNGVLVSRPLVEVQFVPMLGEVKK